MHVMTRGGRVRERDQSGVVAVVAAVLFVALISLGALVVDLGHAREVRRSAQNAADASALAAANQLYLNSNVLSPHIPEAVAAAKAYALQNFGVSDAAWASCTDSGKLAYVPAASTPCISFDEQVKPTTVRVRIPTVQVDTALAGVFGVKKVNVAARAKAMLKVDNKSSCALCILGTGTHDLQNGDATAGGGDIAFNGSVSVGSNGLVATDGRILVQGTATGPLSNYTPDPLTGQAPATDPLSFLTLPPDMSSLTVKTDPCTQGPGKYGSVDLRSKTCTLLPGLYVVAGTSATWDLSGNATTQLLGSGVTVYLTCGTPTTPVVCSANQQGATFDATGNAILGFTAPTSGPLQGLALVMDRNNSSTLRLSGNGASGLKGTIYMPSGILQMNGNGCSTIDSLIVVNDLTMNGNPTCIKSNYLPSDNVAFPAGSLHLTQ
jgi:Flp pilus assembly protein TadG